MVKTPDNKDFYYFIINFGTLGVITRMSVRLYPRFTVFKSIYKNVKWDAFSHDDDFDRLSKHCEYLSMFCNW
jgi:hypothetical protein